jgi:hypothetical protein
VREGGTCFCAAELDTETADAAEDAGLRLRSSNGVRSVRSEVELVGIRRGDDGRDEGKLRRRSEYEYSAKWVWTAVYQRSHWRE